MLLSGATTALLGLVSSTLALVVDIPPMPRSPQPMLASSLDVSEYASERQEITRRQDPSLAGYLGAFFLGADPYVYFYLSNGNDALSFKALNKGSPIMRPTKGTGGVRDPTIVPGGGAEAGKKWYIIGTDLHIGKTTWDAAQRTGSKGIFVWESTDLITWANERLVTVEDNTAGMVWAPEAIWDPARGQYLVHWASKFYPTSDPRHTGSPSNIRIRYAYTSDFKAFSTPQTYIDKSPTNIIDLTFLALPPSSSSSSPQNSNTNNNTFLRFMKDETAKTVFLEVSTTGLFGSSWTRPGGPGATIQSGVEGPAAYLDNRTPGKVHLLLDHYGADGYRPYENMVANQWSNNNGAGGGGGWTASPRGAFPKNLRHGSVLPVNGTLYEALRAKWGG